MQCVNLCSRRLLNSWKVIEWPAIVAIASKVTRIISAALLTSPTWCAPSIWFH